MPGKIKSCWGGSGAAALDEKAKVSAADTTTDFLNNKIVVGTGISKTILNPGANETLSLQCTITDTDVKAKVSAADTTTDFLNNKIVVGTGISKTILNPGANETLSLACTIVDSDIKVKVSAADTTTDFLNSKIAAGTGITKTILNPGANEQLQISTGVSSMWRNVFLPAIISNEGQGGMKAEKIYSSGAGGAVGQNEYDYLNYDQNEETLQFQTNIWSMPFNWKHSSGLKFNLYWFVTGEGSHGTDLKWQCRIRSIGTGETLSFTGTFNNNYQSEAANDLLYITPIVSITPENSGGGLAPLDLLQIITRRQNDSASGDGKLLGIQLHWEIDPTIAVP